MSFWIRKIFALIIFSLILSNSAYAKKPEKKHVKEVSKKSQKVVKKKAQDNLAGPQFYFLIDADTKEVLLEKNADVRIAPSSMTKIMTAYVVFNQVKKGYINLQSQCMIGKDAWRKSGSSMFLNYGDVVSVEDLIKGLLAVSGNDAAIALAETSGGGLNNFVGLMNQQCKELGLKNSHFENPHGLNQNGHYMSIRDLATLTIRLYQDFPQYLHYMGLEEFTYGKVTQLNRNPLIKKDYDGIVGGKTGYTDDGGYGVAEIVKRGNRCLVGVVNKAANPKQRERMILNLMDHGFMNFKKLFLFKKNQEIAKLKTWMGEKPTVAVSAAQDVAFNIPQDKSIEDIKVHIKYKGPIYSPIAKGEKVGVMIVEIKDYKKIEYSLFANETVDKAGYFGRINQILRYKARIFLNKFKH
jgi:D-alanyl-D-alanine carboxypeptidase (penicillin-binding protein 5/6)